MLEPRSIEPTDQCGCVTTRIGQDFPMPKNVIKISNPSEIQPWLLISIKPDDSHRLPIICRGRQHLLMAEKYQNGHRWAYRFVANGVTSLVLVILGANDKAQNNTTLFHSRLKTYLFYKSFPPWTILPGTDSTDSGQLPFLPRNAVLRSHVVCLSVCPSVTLVDHDHIG